jgi:broad specificity phosphatase PhoE
MAAQITSFTFVRHGETTGNISGRMQGWRNAPLTENGRLQAEAVAKALASESFSVIASSDLIRAAETAEAIRKFNRNGSETPFEVTEQLREWHCGECEDITWEEFDANFPHLSHAFKREYGDPDFPGGECRSSYQKRISSVLEDLRERFEGGNILIVSHGGALQRVLRHIVGRTDDTNLIPLAGNASISRFIYNGPRSAWQLVEWNNRSHLKSLPEHETLPQ